MPEYLYKCENEHLEDVVHPMLWSTGVVCAVCDNLMWRVPQAVSVTWGGLAPSDGDLAPEIQQHLSTLDEQRADFEQIHDEHERRTDDTDD